jgi:hypothetical protein
MVRELMIAGSALACALGAHGAAAETVSAVEQTAAPMVQQDATIVVTATAATSVRKARSPHMLTDAELDEQRGGEQLIVANQTLTAVTQGNVLNGDFLAGDVTLSDSALSSFNGVGNILINTGAQVSLQTGMNLTINVNE